MNNDDVENELETVYEELYNEEDIDKLKELIKVYKEILEHLKSSKNEMSDKRLKLSQLSQKKRNASKQVENTCTCCVCNNIINLENQNSVISCNSCKSNICKERPCAIWIPKSSNWTCKLCNSFTNGSNAACDWLLCQINQKFSNKLETDKDQIIWNKKKTSPLIPLEEREKVREFIEELISTIVGGSIDNASVGQLYNNYECLPLGENEENPQDSYSNLKLLVQRIIEEVFKLPDLFDYSGVDDKPKMKLPEFDPKRYEELLATAVLNKIVEGYNYEKRYESSGIHSGSDVDNIGKRRLEVFSSSSSDEPKSDTSITEKSMSTSRKPPTQLYLNDSNSEFDSAPQSPNSVGSSDYLSDYIQNHKVPLPSLNNLDENTNGIDEPFDAVKSDGNWEENWLFQKRKQKNDTTATAMLVPSPTEEVKALIGDKSADEVSDLSEAGTETDDEQSDNESNLSHVLVESKTIIGGKNDVGPFNEIKSVNELLQPDSLISDHSLTDTTPVIMEAKNNLILIDSPVKRSMSPVSIDKQGNKKIESIASDNGEFAANVNSENNPCDETKEELPKKSVDTPIPAPRVTTKIQETKDDTRSTSDKSEVHDLPGSIAEREHLKWKNAQEIPNNPYSPEALQRRLSQPINGNTYSDIRIVNVEHKSLTTSDESIVIESTKVEPLRYERDYYVNSPKNISNQNRHNERLNSSSEDDYIPLNRIETPDISIESYESDIFTAKPILIEESDSKSDELSKANSNVSDQLPSSQQDSLTPSEDSETTRVYDLSKRETKILRHEVIRTSKRPEGAVLTPPPSPVSSETNENNSYVDKFLAIQQLAELRSSFRDEENRVPTKSSPVTSPTLSRQQIFNSNPLSPDAVKSLAPRKKLNFSYKSNMSDEVSVNGTTEKPVIEEEVLSSLPSVKALAKTFSVQKLHNATPSAFNRPKSFSWQSSRDPLDERRRSSGSSYETVESTENLLPPFYSNYHPVAPGHSITARSLSTKFREELKNQITNTTNIDGHTSPERPSSPVLVPGKLKTNIAFFENLNK